MMIERKFLFFLIEARMIILLIFFVMDSILFFYLFIELSLIPVFFIVLGWGYQPERLGAGVWIFLYTLLSAIPFFLEFFYYLQSYFLVDFSLIYFLYIKRFNFSRIFEIFLILGFFVKFPIYIFHIWLPRAHVEAPLLGSILLAAVLLKLAGFGMIKFIPFLIRKNLLSFIKIFRISGGRLVSIICILEKDMKKLIAYRSIGHMRFVILRLSIKNFLGLKGGFIFMITHGVRSSILFLGRYIIYLKRHRRSLFLNFGILRYWPIFRLFWFVRNLGGIRAPPRRRFFREILCIIRRIGLNLNFSLFLGLMLFFSVAYSMILFRRRQYGQRRINKYFLLKDIEFLNLYIHTFILFFFSFILSVL